jgi:hypothetical protein
MRWFKVAAVALGVLIVLLVVSSVIGFLLEAVIAVLVAATIALGIKAAFYKKQVSGKRPDREVRGPAYNSLPRRQTTPNVDDELARLKREMGD